jgi:hypothetical protein
VLKLYRCLRKTEKTEPRQIVSCDTGVGTLARPIRGASCRRISTRFWGSPLKHGEYPGLRQNGASTKCSGASENEREKSSIINKTARRANHFRFSEIVSSPKIKNISVFTNPDSLLHLIHPVPLRGACHDRHERGAGCGGRW